VRTPYAAPTCSHPHFDLSSFLRGVAVEVVVREYMTRVHRRHLAGGSLSTRPVTEPESFVNEDGKTVSRIRVQRSCNGCGEALGDANDVELDAAMLGRRLPDVRLEHGCFGSTRDRGGRLMFFRAAIPEWWWTGGFEPSPVTIPALSLDAPTCGVLHHTGFACSRRPDHGGRHAAGVHAGRWLIEVLAVWGG